jgi:hypothetical protein
MGATLMEKWIFEIPDFETGPIGHSGTSPKSAATLIESAWRLSHRGTTKC